MRKALFLSHVPPFPEVGGDRLRIAQSLRLLAELCHVDVAFISHDRKEWSLKPYVHNIGKEYCFYAFAGTPVRQSAPHRFQPTA